MKTIGFTMLALGLALAALPAGAQGQTSFTLETHTEGGGGYFTLEGETAKNPTLNVAEGEQITVTIKGTDDGVHNFCSAEGECSEYVTAAGETQTFTFTGKSGQYFCLPHKGAGMVGTLSTGATTTNENNDGGNGGETNGSPGFELVGALVALAGLALVLRRK